MNGALPLASAIAARNPQARTGTALAAEWNFHNCDRPEARAVGTSFLSCRAAFPMVSALVDKSLGTITKRALECIGGLTCQAMQTDHHLDFWVNAQKQSDGSLIVNVL